jgi:hypothetical protein
MRWLALFFLVMLFLGGSIQFNAMHDAANNHTLNWQKVAVESFELALFAGCGIIAAILSLHDKK